MADRREARLAEVVVLILDHYLSQRDIWHLHAAMMQDESNEASYPFIS